MASSSGNVHPTPPWDRKLLRWWLIVSVSVAMLFAVSQLLEIRSRSALRGYDNTFNYLWLRSAMVDGDWDFRNDLAQCDTLPPEYRASALALPLSSVGRIPNKYGIGWAVVSAPFYLIADASLAVGRWLGLTTAARDGWSPVYQVCLQLGHLALAALGLVLATRVVAIWTGSPQHAVAGVLLVWAASPLFYYQTVNLSMSHGAAFFAVVLLAYVLLRAERENAPQWWLLAGFAWSLALTTRFQLGFFGLLALWSARRVLFAPRALGRVSALFISGSAPLVILQLAAWRTVYGVSFVFSYGQEGEAFRWLQPELGRSLFSPWHGLFYWHPFLLVALCGLIFWARAQAGIGRLALGLVLLTIYINAAWWCWWFASAFGSRSFDAAILPLMAGLAWLLPRVTPRWRSALVGLAIVAGFWNFYVLLLYRSGAISRSDPVTWGQMIEAVKRVPTAASF